MRSSCARGLLLSALAAMLNGCVTSSSSSEDAQETDATRSSGSSTPTALSTSYTDGNAGLDPALFPGLRIQGEPDDTFPQALTVIFDSNGMGHLEGTIRRPSDVDVYSLGPLAAGDRIIIDMGTPDDRLDAEAAVFDVNELLAFANDDRDYDLGQIDPLINDVIRYDSQAYYLGIASSAFADRGRSTGRYEAWVTVVPGNAVPAASSQIVVLNFNGGTITIPDYNTYTVGVFDTGEIASAYKGMTETVRDQIAATTRQNYTGLALDIRVLPGDTAPEGGQQCSTVYFGGSNSEAFGVSQDVDEYNSNHSDSAIIFTGTFRPQIFGRVLTATELGTAIGNVTSHEIGHLLGLNHVDNVLDLMDTTGTPSTFMGDQAFTTSSLDSSIFPIGEQDSALLLLLTLGGL